MRPLDRQLPVATLLLSVAALATLLAYWVGLSGPFVLDDQNNLTVIKQWLEGQASLHNVVVDGKSGMFGRPLSMGSMALSAWLGGYQPFAFKLGNLLIHLLCGAVIFAFVRRLAARDRDLSNKASFTAVLVAALWLLHPLNSSTVLYAVQRMAQMSTLFLLLGAWFYVAVRSRIETQQTITGSVWLFVGIPAFVLAGMLCKENAILLPGLCLVIEAAYFQDASKPKPRAVRWFLGLYVFLPALVGVAILAVAPEQILGGYMQRDFDLSQRLMSEARALMDYLRLIVVPTPPQMGVFTDDFPPSTGLLSPASTLFAIVALISISLVTWRLRRHMPALMAGWGIFLVGHALESTIFPLELYFEHRNYLPMVGILYALVGAGVKASRLMQERGLETGRIGTVLVAGLLLLFAFGTHGRAIVWSTAESLALSAVSSHPFSMRANLLLVKTALQHGNTELAEESLQRLATAPQPRTRAQAHLIRMYFSCERTGTADPADLASAMSQLPPSISAAELELFSSLFSSTPKGCGAVSDEMIGDALAGILDRMLEKSALAPQRWHIHFLAAEFYLRAGEIPKARQHAELAWQPTSDLGVAAIAVQTALAMSDIAAARAVFAQARDRVRMSDPAEVAWLHAIQAEIDKAAASP